MKFILYTTHCPRCRAMEAILAKAGISKDSSGANDFTSQTDNTYREVTNVAAILARGVRDVPWLEDETGRLMNIGDAKNYFNQ